MEAFIERQPIGFTALQLGAHKYLILVYSKMNEGSFLKGEQDFPIVSCRTVLLQCIACVLIGELVFKLQGCHWYSVERKDYINRILVFVAVINLSINF